MNHGMKSDALVGVVSAFLQSGTVVAQERGGVMRMRRILSARPSTLAELKPGGDHIMLMGLKRQLKVGDHIVLTLRFQSGATGLPFMVKKMVTPRKESLTHYPARV